MDYGKAQIEHTRTWRNTTGSRIARSTKYYYDLFVELNYNLAGLLIFMWHPPF